MGYGLSQSQYPEQVAASAANTVPPQRDLMRIRDRASQQAAYINEISAAVRALADQIFGQEPAPPPQQAMAAESGLRPVGPLMPEINEAQDAVDNAIGSLRRVLERLNAL